MSFHTFFNNIDDASVAFEACYAWEPTYERLKERGFEVKLAHPLELEAIAHAKKKTDRRDSEILADLNRANLIPEVYVPCKEIRKLRDKLRRRARLVWDRTKYKQRIRAELSKHKIQIDYYPWSKRGMHRMDELGVPAINDFLAIIKVLDERIDRISKELKKESEESEEARLLMTIPGVGYFSAMCIVASIADIDRFSNEEKLCSYAGLVPSTRQSGSIVKHGAITKQGDRYIRWTLIECVWQHMKWADDTRLTRFYKRIKRRKGKKVAVVATARKMLVSMYYMLKRREEFRP